RAAVVAIHTHGLHCAASLRGNPLPYAELLEEIDIPRGERVNARVELLVRGRRRRGFLSNERNADAGGGAGKARADRPAADDDQIELHGFIIDVRSIRRGELAQLVRAAES